MSAQPLVSVHMITYNHEPYIAQAIECVLNQKTTFPFELVIGEDCSTDNTRSILRDYQQKYPHKIRILTSENNVGMHNNWLRTTIACKGKYIAYCEGDDYWHNENKLDKQIKFLEEHADYVMIHSDVLNLMDGILCKSYLSYNPEFDDSRAYLDILSSKRVIGTVSVCAKKDTILEVLCECPECVDEKYPMADLQMWLEVSIRGKVKYLEEPLATYRMLPSSVSHGSKGKILQFILATKDLRYHYLSKYDCPDHLATQIRINTSAVIFKYAIRHGFIEIADAELEGLRLLANRPPLSWKDYFWYWSWKNVLLRRICEIVTACNNRPLKNT